MFISYDQLLMLPVTLPGHYLQSHHARNFAPAECESDAQSFLGNSGKGRGGGGVDLRHGLVWCVFALTFGTYFLLG